MIPVILSGGSGTRLWPVSRQSFPKQFCDLFDESLLQKTLKRLMPLGSPWVITLGTMKTLTEKTMSECGIPVSQAVYEPQARNTAPAIALLCKVLEQSGKTGEVVGIFPADHFVEKLEDFHRLLREAEKIASSGQAKVVTLGIRPSFPSTGYGYIETDPAKKVGSQAVATRAFREKPKAADAEAFVKAGCFFWNAGIFVFRVSDMIQSLRECAPAIWEGLSGLEPSLGNLATLYARLPSISIDYAVMEKLPNQCCIPADIGWSDVGSWDEVARLSSGAPAGTVVEVASSGNYVHPYRDKKYGFVGAEDLLVIDTADALLVSKKGASQDVKQVVDRLRESGSPVATEHPFEFRPWGKFEVLRDTPRFKSKVIHVAPGHQLSYQSHAKRAEHWVIIAGEPEVVLNDQVLRPKPGEAVFIPQGAKHRMRNPGREAVEFVEVQVGSYFGEDDIVRYQDDYRRA